MLLEARRTCRALADLGEFRPRDEAEAYAVQDAVIEGLGLAVAGWKTGAPSPDADAGFAPIFEVTASPAVFAASSLRLFGIEAEIAFRLALDLPPRDKPYEEAEIVAAIGSVHPAVELVESRFADFHSADPMAKLADNGSNGALILGPAIPDWQALDLARPPVTIRFDGVEAARTTGNTGGDPRRLLAALADHLAHRRGGLHAGDVVTSGSCTGLVFARPGTTVAADFGAAGLIELTFPVEAS